MSGIPKVRTLEEYKEYLEREGIIDDFVRRMLWDLRDSLTCMRWLVWRREGYYDVVITIDDIDWIVDETSEDLSEDLEEEEYYRILSERTYVVKELLKEKLRERGLRVVRGRDVGEVFVILDLPYDILEAIRSWEEEE